MLGKLFKYDMKQISRIMLPLVLLTFGTTLFGTAALKTVNEVVVPMESGVAQNVLLSSLYMVFGISVFVLCAFAVMAILFTVARFYKNLFTDEGFHASGEHFDDHHVEILGDGSLDGNCLRCDSRVHIHICEFRECSARRIL